MSPLRLSSESHFELSFSDNLYVYVCVLMSVQIKFVIPRAKSHILILRSF